MTSADRKRMASRRPRKPTSSVAPAPGSPSQEARASHDLASTLNRSSGTAADTALPGRRRYVWPATITRTGRAAPFHCEDRRISTLAIKKTFPDRCPLKHLPVFHGRLLHNRSVLPCELRPSLRCCHQRSRHVPAHAESPDPLRLHAELLVASEEVIELTSPQVALLGGSTGSRSERSVAATLGLNGGASSLMTTRMVSEPLPGEHCTAQALAGLRLDRAPGGW